MASLKEDLRMRWATGGMAVRLIMVNVLVFLLLATLRLLVTLGIPIPPLPGAFGLATTSDLGLLAFRPWSALTHMFAHTQVWHLVMNMLILWWMGGMFRSYFGDRRTLSTYLMGGWGLCSTSWRVTCTAFPMGYALGASSAVMALMVATALTPDTVIRLFILGPVKLKWVALAYVVLDYVALEGSNVGGHLGHIGGAAYGCVYATCSPVGTWAWIERVMTARDRVRIVGKEKRARESVGRDCTRCTAASMWTDDPGAQTDEEFNAEKAGRAH